MAELKTKKNNVSVEALSNSIENEKRKKDSFMVLASLKISQNLNLKCGEQASLVLATISINTQVVWRAIGLLPVFLQESKAWPYISYRFQQIQ